MPDDRSLADLCRPLSARAMPPGKRYSPGGREMTEARAMMAQRNGHHQKPGATPPKPSPSRKG